ncbi:hypothetical protein P0Y35_05855 [Kiritimatiellaeota bacterium B1221]|nr:hypothetical protein [Kiritimatiellaeota bacterium B1221]
MSELNAQYAAMIKNAFIPAVDRLEFPDHSGQLFTDWSDEPTRLLTRKDIAAMFGVKPGTVARWAADGLADYPGTGGERLYIGFQVFQFCLLRHERSKNQPRGIPLMRELEQRWMQFYRHVAGLADLPKRPPAFARIFDTGLYDFFWLGSWGTMPEAKGIACPFLLGCVDEGHAIYEPKR